MRIYFSACFITIQGWAKAQWERNEVPEDKSLVF